MTVDRGGLEYPIRIENEWSEGLNSFRRDIKSARNEVKKLRDDIKSLKQTSKDIASVARSLSSAEKTIATSRQKSAKATDAEAAATAKLVRLRKQLANQLDTLQLKATDKQLRKLREEIALEKQRIRTQDQRTQAVNKEIVQQRRLAAATKAVVAAQDRIALANNKGVQKARLLAEYAERTAAAQRKLALARNQDLTRLNAQVRAEQAIARYKEKQLQFDKLAAFARQQGLVNNLQALRDLGISKGRAQSLGLVTAPTPPELTRIQRASAFFKDLNKSMALSGGTANRISFTFRRLFGILAAFALARQGIAIFVRMVKEMISFNAQLEQATLGIATLLTAVGDIRTFSGDVADPILALNLAQIEARKQINLLRRDALRTVATFEQLRDAFQTALAPGLQAGLDVDQIRSFSVRISQAAQAIGLSQEQLAEEIRSILSGTIRTRTTRIAVALGITNQDIENMKQAGTLSQFLEERFRAFEVAGEESLNTFNALFTNLRDGLSLVLGAGGIEFFEQLKTVLKDIKDAIIVTDDLGVPSPSPDAIRAAEAVGDGLVFAIEQARTLGKELRFSDIENIGQAIGETIKTIALLVKPVVAGILDALGIISGIVTTVNAVLGTGAFQKSLEAVVAILATSIAINTVWYGITLVMKTVTVLMTAMKLLAVQLQLGWAATLSIVVGLAIVAAGLVNIMSSRGPSNELNRQREAASRLQELYDKLGVSVVGVSEALKQQSETITKIKEELRDAVDALDKFKFTRGLTGTAKDTLDLVFEQQIKLRERALDLSREERELREGLAGIEAKNTALQDAKNILSKEELTIFNKINRLDRQGLDAIDRRIRLETEIKQLKASGDEDSLSRAKELEKQTEKLKELAQDIGVVQGNITNDIAEQIKSTSPSALGLTFVGQDFDQRVEETANRLRKLSEDTLQAEKSRENQLVRIQTVEEAQLELRREQLAVTFELRKLEAERAIFELTRSANAQEYLNLQERTLQLFEKQFPADRLSQEFLQEKARLELAKQRAQVNEEDRQRNLRALTQQFARDYDQLGPVGAVDDTFRQLVDQASQLEDQLTQIERGHVAATKERVASLRGELDSVTNNLASKAKSLELDLRKVLEASKQSGLDRPVLEGNLKNGITLLEQINALIRDNTSQREAENLEIDRTTEAVDRLRDAIERPVSAGLRQGLIELAQETPTVFEQTLELMKDSVRDFSSFLSRSIVDSLAGEDVDLKERFRQLLLGIADQILEVVIQRFIVQQLLQNFLNLSLQATKLDVSLAAAQLQASSVALTAGGTSVLTGATAMQAATVGMSAAAPALSSAGFVLQAAAVQLQAAAAALAAARAGGLGFAEGGNVGAHATAKGLVAGGSSTLARPAGLDPKDTVPAWLDPAEWVIRGKSVRKYGSRVMAAINAGLVDPFALKALVGARGALRSPSRKHVMGFAEGGSAGGSQPQSRTDSGGSRVVGAVIVPTNDAMRLLAQKGEQALLEFLSDHGFSPGR